ncbi:transcriptional regulator BetI [Erwinia pyrifoliae]|uniref:HTH-type transcriptional regulator BetI n=1 Tax=Erwinia pyrifoliae TaxID=79967 RepID=A0ABY5XCM6_ERWPY|nr:transcriptional regulator BetI [Erwinia pyrifoliae]AUX72644.1 transcriptional regulator BetI [Erwinia pyrifoliae]MCA8877093.1 transcriptional regulator BetI [Erwinia pyrifoliae]MCU8587157.1 transcriptional regulator BetI [Erwinia pyrifoliae]UWS35185.1 transcriptional regulator BetI [Erwinia pyrifoliae]UXK14004.1 transcriptional regulator BetI [Erwinia pyrifoliae]
MPKIGMKAIRQAQLINATLTVIDRVGLANASLALIAKEAGVSTGIVSHYFGDKNSLLEACMLQILSDLYVALRHQRLKAGNDAEAQVKAIIDGNFDISQITPPVLKTWLVFWAESLYQPNLNRLQRINDRRLYSNLTAQFRRVMPGHQARAAASSLAAIIDGLWLRLTLAPLPMEQGLEQARMLCYQNLALWLNSAVTP